MFKNDSVSGQQNRLREGTPVAARPSHVRACSFSLNFLTRKVSPSTAMTRHSLPLAQHLPVLPPFPYSAVNPLAMELFASKHPHSAHGRGMQGPLSFAYFPPCHLKFPTNEKVFRAYFSVKAGKKKVS